MPTSDFELPPRTVCDCSGDDTQTPRCDQCGELADDEGNYDYPERGHDLDGRWLCDDCWEEALKAAGQWCESCSDDNGAVEFTQPHAWLGDSGSWRTDRYCPECMPQVLVDDIELWFTDHPALPDSISFTINGEPAKLVGVRAGEHLLIELATGDHHAA